jgi:hypothetical protein
MSHFILGSMPVHVSSLPGQRLPQGGGDNDFLRYSPIGFPDQSERGMAQA